MPEDGWGWTDVHVDEARRRQPTSLTAPRFEQPDDGNADDRTVMRVPLPHAGAARRRDRRSTSRGTAQLPRVFARTGYSRDYYLVGQWFPKIGVYEPAGVRGRTAGGWNCHQFHAQHRVLRGLRPVRRHHHRALGVRRRRHRPARSARARTPTARRRYTLRAGRRARLRVDGRSATTSSTIARVLGDGRRHARPSTRRRPRCSAGRSTRCG